MELLFPLIFLVLMWVLLVRPQQQRVRHQRELVASLSIGDEVVTVGGIMGRITGLDQDHLTLQVAPGVDIRVLRMAVNGRVGEEPEEPALGEGAE
ncbi:MAG TPA: preprotein translocase subunit YajC [Acidimicrobiales bacterium]|nr:preprotein translocase subunit YajC [Acidimicrobiales bacterium]